MRPPASRTRSWNACTSSHDVPLQVLGTLAFHAKGTSWDDVHAFQDRVREAGGLIEVLSLTQLDELNPYIREHAIFALRNLLDRNPTSQDHVAQLRPHT